MLKDQTCRPNLSGLWIIAFTPLTIFARYDWRSLLENKDRRNEHNCTMFCSTLGAISTGSSSYKRKKRVTKLPSVNSELQKAVNSQFGSNDCIKQQIVHANRTHWHSGSVEIQWSTKVEGPIQSAVTKLFLSLGIYQLLLLLEESQILRTVNKLFFLYWIHSREIKIACWLL